MPKEAYPETWPMELGPFYGHEYFGIEPRPCLPLNLGPIPPFETQVLKETDRYILYRDENGILRKALKEGTVRETVGPWIHT